MKKSSPEIDVEKLKAYMKLSPKEKLEYLEAMNLFLMKITPKKSKRIWQKLKASGKF